MKNLKYRINKFYKYYSINNIKLSRADMHDKDTLMNVYENMWLNMDEDGPDLTDDECAWLTNLYGDLGDYIADMHTLKYKWQSLTMGNIVCTFGEVIAQIFSSLFEYHTLDIQWKYNKNGF